MCKQYGKKTGKGALYGSNKIKKDHKHPPLWPVVKTQILTSIF